MEDKSLRYSTPPRAARSLDEAVRDLSHGVEVFLGILDVLESLGIVRLDASLDEDLERLLVLVPLVKLGVGDGLRLLLNLGDRLHRSLGRLPRAGLLLAGLLLAGVALPLAAPRCGSARRGRRSGLGSGAVVVVHTPHVVPEVPLPGETVAGDGALAALVGAQVRLLPVAVHGVGLTLMAEEAGSRRKPGILAALDLAAVRLEVRVDKFAAMGVSR